MSILETFQQAIGLQLSQNRFEKAELTSPEIQALLDRGRNLTPEIVEQLRQEAEVVNEQKALVQDYVKYGREAYLGRAEIDSELIRGFLPIDAEANGIRSEAIVEAQKKREGLLKIAQSNQKYLRGVM